MDLSKIKNGYKEYDYEINALLGLKVGEKYLVVDENKEPYKIYCVDKDCAVYQSINERGQMSCIKKKAKCANDFIVESVTGAKYKINLDKESNTLFETSINKNGTTMVSMSLICYAICSGYDTLNSETIRKLRKSGVVATFDAFIHNEYEEDYSITSLGNDFLCADFHMLKTDNIERFITNSNLIEYNDFDVSTLVKITPIDKMKLKMENGRDRAKEYKKGKEVCKQFRENVRTMLNEEDKSKSFK